MNDLYTILINEDHSFTHTNKKKIMYRSTGIDTVRFLVNQKYNDLDMRTANVVLEYVTPVNRSYGVVVLTPSAELYKNRVEYLLPIDLKFTSEIGDLEFTINFSRLNMNEEGFLEQVRPIGYTSIKIHDTVRWSDYIASSNLDNIAQIMLTNQSLMEQQKQYAEMLAYEKADNIAKDEETNEIYLTANGVQIGNRIKDSDTCTAENGVPVVEFDSINDPGSEDTSNEVDNVVEF
jgi:hypothetical protein